MFPQHTLLLINTDNMHLSMTSSAHLVPPPPQHQFRQPVKSTPYPKVSSNAVINYYHDQY